MSAVSIPRVRGTVRRPLAPRAAGGGGRGAALTPFWCHSSVAPLPPPIGQVSHRSCRPAAASSSGAWFTGGLLPYVATVAWVLCGVIVSTVQEGYPVLSVAAGVGLATVLVTAVLAPRHAGRSFPDHAAAALRQRVSG
jgi:hypothetical protein